MTPPAVYCIDTSSLIFAANDAYPLDVFASFWSRLDVLVGDGRVIAPREVLKEISRQDDDLHLWCKNRNGLFVPNSIELQRELLFVNAQFPSLVDLKKGRGLADPWVVALGKLSGATVVTEEDSKPTWPKIPDACLSLGIPRIRLLDVIRQEGWTWN